MWFLGIPKRNTNGLSILLQTTQLLFPLILFSADTKWQNPILIKKSPKTQGNLIFVRQECDQKHSAFRTLNA